MAALNLEQLAAETAGRLHAVWNELGVGDGERATFLAQLSADVAAIYKTRVEDQNARKVATEMDITALQGMIAALQNAVEEQAALPSSAGLTLLQFKAALEQRRGALQQVYDGRYNELRSLEKALFQLYSDISAGVEPGFTAIGEYMSMSRIAAYSAEINRVQAIKAERAGAIAGLCQEVSELWRELVVAPHGDFDAAITTGCAGLGWGLPLIAQLEFRRDELRTEKAAREAKVMALGEAITALWKRLMTPVEMQTAFLDANSGISDAVVVACEAYLAELQAEFRSKLVHLIGHARSTMSALWDECRIGGEDARRANFPAYFLANAEGGLPIEGVSTPFTDDLYQAHEDHIKALSVLLEERRPFLTDIARREAMLGDKAEYEAIVSDPARLLVKGSSAARLREEKLERRVKKELPALSRKLREKLETWEGAHGTPFLVDGARWLDVLDREEASEASKHAEERAKRDAHRKDKAGIPQAEAPPVPVAPAALGATAAAGGAALPGRMSVYRPAILNATLAAQAGAKAGAGALGATQALAGGARAGMVRKPSAALHAAGAAEDGSSGSAAAPAARAGAAPVAPPVLGAKARSYTNVRAPPSKAVAAAGVAAEGAEPAKVHDTVLPVVPAAYQGV